MTNKTISFPVFIDDRGNRFIFPGYFDTSEGEIRTSWSRSHQICAVLSVNKDDEKFTVDIDENDSMNFPHVVADAVSSGFAHGGSIVWIISGPTFDEILAEQNEAKSD